MSKKQHEAHRRRNLRTRRRQRMHGQADRRQLGIESLETRQLLAAIDGTVFKDLDRNGQYDAGENGLAGWTVFLDESNDGVRNGNDPTAVTDQQGNYAIANVPPGTHTVRLEAPAGWHVTAPVSLLSSDAVAGTIEATSLDTDPNGFAPGMPAPFSPLQDTVSLNAGLEVGRGGNVYVPTNSSGVVRYDPVTGNLVEPHFIDASHFGLFPTGLATDEERGILYVADRIGRILQFDAETGAPLSPAAIGEDPLAPASPVGVPQSLAMGPDGNLYIGDSSNRAVWRYNPEFLTFDELLTDGTDAPNGLGIAFDPQSRRLFATGDSGVLIFEPTGEFVAANPLTQSPRGLTFDGNQQLFISFTNDGTVEQYDTSTGALQPVGTVASGLAPMQLALTSRAPHRITAVGGESHRLNFGAAAVIAGRVFEDHNGTGRMDVDDVGLAGQEVYIDLNNDGLPDAGEPAAVTDADGYYELTPAVPLVGQYPVRWASEPGRIQTAPVVVYSTEFLGDQLRATTLQTSASGLTDYVSHSFPPIQGQFAIDGGLEPGPDGLLYAATAADGVVRIDTITGQPLAEPSFIDPAHFNVFPAGIAFDYASNTLYVGDRSGAILDFNATTGNLLDPQGIGTLPDGGVPESLAMGLDGNLYVLDSANLKVWQYNTGTQNFAGFTTGEPAPLVSPSDLAFDPGTGDLYVSSTDELYRYDSSGAFISATATTNSTTQGLVFGPGRELFAAAINVPAIDRYVVNSTVGPIPLGSAAFNVTSPVSLAVGQGSGYFVDFNTRDSHVLDFGGTPPGEFSWEETVAAIQEVGRAIQAQIQNVQDALITGGNGGQIPSGLELFENTADWGAAVADAFFEVSARLLHPASLAAGNAGATTTNPVRLVISDGNSAVELTLDGTQNPVADLNQALPDATAGTTLENQLEFADDNGEIVLGPAAGGLTSSLFLSTLRLDADGPLPPNGQLATDTQIQLTVERTSNGVPTSETFSFTLRGVASADSDPAAPDTADNIDLGELAADINAALVSQGVSDIRATFGIAANRLSLVATSPAVSGFTLDAGGGSLGFGNLVAGLDMGASDLGFEPTQAIGKLKFDSIGGLTAVLKDLLVTVSPDLPLEFDLNPLYNAIDDSLEFNFSLTKGFSEQVGLDFLAEGVDLGPLGRIEVASAAAADLTVDAALDFRMGVYLGGLLDLALEPLTVQTPLSLLNAGDGVDLLVGMTAVAPAPVDGQVGRNVTFALEIEREVGGYSNTSRFDLTLPHLTDTSNPDLVATDDNFNVASLVSDLNRLLPASLAGELEFDSYEVGDELRLRLLAQTTGSLSPIRRLTMFGGEPLGFAAGQQSDYADLEIFLGDPLLEPDPSDSDCSDNACYFTVALDGATRVDEVLDRIEEAAPDGAVLAGFSADGSGFSLEVNPSVVAAETAISVRQAVTDGERSLAGIGLGLIGTFDLESRSADPLHGKSLLDRIYIVEPAAGTDNLVLTASVTADVNASAALGKLGFELISQNDAGNDDPLHVVVSSSAGFRDPGTVADDGRISLTEMFDAPDQVIDLANLIPTVSASGTLQLIADTESTNIFGESTGTGPTDLFSISVQGDSANGIQFNADANMSSLASQFKDLCVADIIGILRDIAGSLKSGVGPLNAQLPLLGRSPNQTFAIADGLLAAVDDFISDIDLPSLQLAVGDVNLAIANLSLPLEARAELFELGAALTALPVPPLNAVDLPEFEARLPGKLVASWRLLNRLIAELPEATAGLPDLQWSADSLGALIPSWNTIETRLESSLGTALSSTLGLDAADVAVRLGFIADYDLNTPDPVDAPQRAVVLGIELNGLSEVDESFELDLPSTDLGPIAFNTAGDDPRFRARGGISLGFGITLDAARTLFVVADPAAATDASGLPLDEIDDDLIPTQLSLVTGFQGSISGDVSLGSLSLVEGQAALSLLGSETERTAVAVGGEVGLLGTPADGNADLILVRDEQGNTVPVIDLLVDATGTTIIVDAMLAGTDVEVQYALDVPGEQVTLNGDGEATLAAVPVNVDDYFVSVSHNGAPVADFQLVGATLTTTGLAGQTVDVQYLDPATLAVDLDPSTTAFSNTMGAVLHSELAPRVTFDGMAAGTVDLAFLGSEVNDAISLAIPVADPLSPKITLDTDGLSNLLAGVDFDLKTILTGIELFLDSLEGGLAGELLGSLPIAGAGFNVDKTFIADLRLFVETLRDVLCDLDDDMEAAELEIRDAVFNFFEPLGMLRNAGGQPSHDINDVQVDLEADSLVIDLKVGGRDEMTVDFDSGISGLAIDASGQGGVALGWDYLIDLGFGVDRQQGFFFVVDDNAAGTPEVMLDLDVGLAVDDSGDGPIPTSFSVDLFGLDLSATDNLKPDGTTGTSLSGSLDIDIQDPNDNRQLLLSELTARSFTQVFQPTLATTASIDLQLTAGLASNLPQLQADLVASWDAGLSPVQGTVRPTFGAPVVRLENIGVDVAAFLQQHVGVVFDRIQQFVEPIAPVIELLLQEIPGVSDLSKAAGKGPVTLIDLALVKQPELARDAERFLQILDSISDLTTTLAALAGDNTYFVLMDQLNLVGGTPLAGGEAEAGAMPDLNDPAYFSDRLDVDRAVAESGGQTSTADETSGTVKSLLQQIGDLGISLHFLDVTNVAGLLMGQTVDVMSFDLPRVDLPIDLSQKFPVVPVPPIAVEVGFHAGVLIDLSVGYDSRGVATGNFFDGFYFGDRAEVFAGADIDEFGLSIGASLAALLDVVVASAGVEGKLQADIVANWRDLDDNGKVYLDELDSILATDGLSCVFDLHGELRAIISLVWEVLGDEGRKEIVDKVLFSFDNSCPTFELGHVSGGNEALAGGPEALSAAGMLILHAGAFADERGPGRTSDVAEAFTVTQLAPGVVHVEGMGLESRYSGVSSIYFDGGKENDQLILVDVDVPVIALGGDGDDFLQGGDAADYLDGGSGEDELMGGGAGDELIGGSDNDRIEGGAGRDVILAGSGDDDVLGGDGGDEIDGGSGDDLLDGGDGDNAPDVINGGLGHDRIFGYGGQDVLDGAGGDDQVFGGEGGDTIFGGAGFDLLFGEGGADYIEAGSGDDLVSGGLGDDDLFGQSGNDVLVGGVSNATPELESLILDTFGLDAGFFVPPPATVDADDELWGGTGNDLLVGDEGQDTLLGGRGDDAIVAQHILLPNISGLPESHVEYIEGGPDDDFICGSAGNDEIYGGVSNFGLGDFPDSAPRALDPSGLLAEGGFTLSSCAAEPQPVGSTSRESTISGVVFEDLNGDGTRDPDEPVLPGWTVYLFDHDGQLAAQSATDDMGAYRFTELARGTYTVSQSIIPGSRPGIPGGYEQTLPPADAGHEVELLPFAAAGGNDFGNHFRSATLRGQAFHDRNADAARDLGENGLNGWQILLFDAQGQQIAATMTADRDLDGDTSISFFSEKGWYEFSGLAPGTYRIGEVPRAYWLQSAPGFSAGNIASYRPLNDDGFTATESAAVVAGLSGSTTAVLVQLEIDHPHLEQLDAYLVSPRGTRVDLFSNVAGDGLLAVFDDNGTTPIATRDPESTDTFFAPEGELANLAGEDPNGTWTLVVKDEVAGGAGRLLNWSLNLVTDADGVVPPIAGGAVEINSPERVRYYEVTINAGETLETGLDFGAVQPGAVSGRKFQDLDGDGQPGGAPTLGGEPGLAGVTIFADLNNNGQLDASEPYTVTVDDDPLTPLIDETGEYHLGSLPVGRETIIRELVPLGFQQTAPAAGFHTVDLVSREVLPSRDFGNRADGIIQGWKYEDVNGNGRRDPGEPGLGGVEIYVDTNRNGQHDPGEPLTTSGAMGEYRLEHLGMGAHIVREIVPAGFVQTSAAQQVVYQNSFGEGPVGSEWSDRAVADSPERDRRILGLFDNETVTLHLDGLPTHDQLQIAFTLIVAGDWEGNHGGFDPDRWKVAVRDGVTLLDTTFSTSANSLPTFQNPSNRYDTDKNGVTTPLDALRVINELNRRGPRTLGIPVVSPDEAGEFLDPSGDGFVSPLDVLHIVNVLNGASPAAVAAEVGEYYYAQSFPANYGLGEFAPHAEAVEFNSEGHGAFALPSTDVRFRQSSSVYRLSYTIAHQGDSLTLDFSGSELENLVASFEQWGMDDVVISIPQEFHTVDVDHRGLVAGVNFGNFDLGSVQGTKWEDLDGDGRRSPSTEPGLAGVTIYADVNNNASWDAGEPSDQTATDGSYLLSDLPAGSYPIREVVPAGYRQTAPQRGFHPVRMTSGLDLAGFDFGNEPIAVAPTDFGDAPAPYPTLLGDDGARHLLVNGIRLGAEIDSEPTGLPSPAADLDDRLPVSGPDDEDGVKFVDATGNSVPPRLIPGGNLIFDVTGHTDAGQAGYLNVWLDLNGDGDWEDAGEQFVVDRPLSDGVSTRITRPVPPGINVNDVYARFRFSTQTGLASFGEAIDGEVEDYRLSVVNGNGGDPPAGQADSGQADGEPTSMIFGTVWFDENADGVVPDAGRQRVGGVRVYADLDLDGTYDPGEPSAISGLFDLPGTAANEAGTYQLMGINPGEVSVRIEIGPFSLSQSYPADDHTVVVPADGQPAGPHDFGVQQNGSVGGYKWLDEDGDGQRDDNEPRQADVWIYWDENRNGQYDDDERRVKTSADNPETPQDETGNYQLFLPPGSHHVREIVPGGYQQVAPANGFHEVDVTANHDLTGYNFGNQAIGLVSGFKWRDLDGNQMPDVDEPRLSGVEVYADLNNNGVRDAGEPWTTTVDDDPDTSEIETGQYELTLKPGTYRIREVVPLHFEQDFPVNGYHQVQIQPGQEVTFRNFGNRRFGSIAGVKFLDQDGDAAQDMDEAGLAGVTINLTDPNGTVIASTVTRTDDPATDLVDETGTYRFDNVAPGNYRVNEVIPAGYQQTLPDPLQGGYYVVDVAAEEHVRQLDFGNQRLVGSIAGIKWSDENSNGVREDLEPGLAGVTIELVDAAGNIVQSTTTVDNEPATAIDETGSYEFVDLPVGVYTVREVVPSGYVQTAPGPNGVHVVEVTAGAVRSGIDFGNVRSAEIHGLKWVDFDGNGMRDPHEPGWAGITVYLDENGNGVRDNNEATTVTLADDGATPSIDESGRYAFTNVAPNRAYEVREVLPLGAAQTFPVEPHAFTLAPGEIRQDVEFGNQPRGIVSGTKWDDLDGDGQWDEANEPGLPGVTIYADIDGDRRWDPSAEPFAVTAADGRYTLGGLPAGSYTIREVVPDDHVQTFPQDGHVVTVYPQLVFVERDFGNHRGTAAILGQAWEDHSGLLGVRDNEDAPIDHQRIPGGVVVYLDDDLDGERGVFEPQVATDDNGQYAFEGLAPGTYTVRIVVPDGWRQSAPGDGAHTVSLSVGDVRPARQFGLYEVVEIEDGDDVVFAGAGRDLVYGDNLVRDDFGAPDPRVVSIGTRQDMLHGDAGADQVFGQEEADELWGDAPDAAGEFDELDGGEGVDTVLQTIDADQSLFDDLLTGQGDDVLVSIERAVLAGGAAGNIMDASSYTRGSVVLDGADGDDQLTGTAGNDVLIGGAGSDQLAAGGGDDLLDGGSGSDTQDGGPGNDRFQFAAAGVAEIDTITAGTGTDELDFSRLLPGDPLLVDLAASSGSHANRDLTFLDPAEVENVTGGGGDDQLYGSSANNVLVGGAGDDTLSGGAGHDVLDGGPGDDSLAGGSGDDTYWFEDGWGTNDQVVWDESGNDTLDLSSVSVDLTALFGGLSVTDGTHAVTHAGDVHAGDVIEHLITGTGDDQFVFQDSAHLADGGSLAAGAGVDTVDYSAYTSGIVVDLAGGSAEAAGTTGQISGVENVSGGAGADTLTGDGLDNELAGGAGDDTLFGLAGNDTLQGGPGNDTVAGNEGDDHYIFAPVAAAETDTIAELLDEGVDTLDFHSSDRGIVIDLTADLVVDGVGTQRSIVVQDAGQSLNFEVVEGTSFDDEFRSLGDVEFRGGVGDDLYRVSPLLAGTVTVVEDDLEGAGNDTIDFTDFSVGVVFDLRETEQVVSTGTPQGVAGDIMILFLDSVGTPAKGIENIRGGAGDDVLTGNERDNVIDGASGNDVIDARRGADTLVGGAGTNDLVGGAGDDVFRFEDVGVPTVNNLVEGVGFVSAGQLAPGGVDTLDFSAVTFSVSLDLRDVSTTNGLLVVNLLGTAGVANSAYFENVIGSATAANTLTGNEFDNLLVGGADQDVLDGGDGADIVLGLAGNDLITVPNGRNLLVGGDGTDSLIGGNHGDILVAGQVDYEDPLDRRALQRVRAAWVADGDYADRIDAIMADLDDGDDVVRLRDDETVFDDLVADDLDGLGGLDWYFADQLDTVNREVGEQ